MQTNEQPLRVCIIDDSPDCRMLYKHLLSQDRDHTYCFTEAEYGKDAMSLCRTEQFDCVLLDYQLPDFTGLEFLTALTATEGKITTPIIMITGQGSETLVVEAMRLGVADYLPKHVISAQSLGRTVINAITKHRLRTALNEQFQALQKTNGELQRKTEEIQSFYHMLAHELKTPLTAARSFSTLMLDGLAGPLSQQQQEYLSYIKASCDQIACELNDLLDTTRLDTGRLLMHQCPTAITTVVSHAMLSIAPHAHDKDIRLQECLAQDLPEAFIDEQRIVQVLTNLLSNALKFTPTGGDVTVTGDHDPERPGWLRLAVSDTGCGIAPEQYERIFDRLYQVRSEDAAIKGGLGLGLYICRELINMHGGQIWVESELNVGSTFFLTLPTMMMTTTKE